MTFYMVLRQDIGLKSDVLEALRIFGMRTSVVAFHCLSKRPEEKNSCTASVTPAPTISHIPLKNSPE